MKYLLIFCVIAAALYLLAIRGRRNHPGWKRLEGWKYAHRGLHDSEKPENSMAAFRAALEAGYGIELDVHLLADGNLAVIHDSSLKRTAGADVNIETLTTPQLTDYRLQGTGETIPEFRQVLELFQGKAPLIVELKTADNCPALCEAACEMLDRYDISYCVESFDPRCVAWLRKHRPDIIRGQLSENYVKRGSRLPLILQWVLTHHLENFLTRPDFVAYHFDTRQTLSNALCRKLWGLRGVTWTLRTPADFDTAVQEGWIPIFENFQP